MEAWDVVVVGATIAGMRAAIAAHDEGASVTILSSHGLGNSGSDTYSSGVAASLDESNSISHRDDTIRGGDWLNDQDIVFNRTSLINSHIAELDQWGLNFRRSLSGSPKSEKGLGHKSPRVLSTGYSTSREIQHVLEEQCIRRNIMRRGDWFPFSLSNSNGQVTGIVGLDMVEGMVESLQAKAVIIADDGFENAWNPGNNSSRGLSIALDAGCQLRDLEFISWNPLGIPDTEISLSIDMLQNGGKLTTSSGTEIQINSETTPNKLAYEINNAGGTALLDATALSKTAKEWYAGLNREVKNRTGFDMSEQLIPVSPKVEQTVGGLPVDEHGRVIKGNWDNWYTGLYSAGGASCSGLNGTGIIAGNRLMEDLIGGSSAGMHAGKWINKKNFGGTSSLEETLFSAQATLSDLISNASSNNTSNVNKIKSKLEKLISSNMGFERSLEGLETASNNLENLEREILQENLIDNNMIMNTNLTEIMELRGLISITRASIVAAISRAESRGSHQRTDIEETFNDTMLKHTLVDSNLQINWLPLRKSASGTWILTPSN
ncbi:MAG TPA: FAD-binding protein [Candidatus Poseidoniaceae archaeon]|nr:FAD-binding protein [Candidatus Poseidoniaceae archaeon]